MIGTLLQPDPEARFRTASGARKALAAAVELLPDPEPDEEAVEVFDQIGPLPAGFSPDGPIDPAPSVEETGSFRLPPPAPRPLATAPTPPTPATQAPVTPAPTRPYTATATGAGAAVAAPAAALAPPVPPPPAVAPAVAPAVTAAHAATQAPARRPGPPARVVVPMLLVAALCLAFGFWALSASS